jgi:hypothetical protein
MKVADLTYLLVPRLCLGTHIRRLCLQSFPATNEAEPLEIGSQALPGNQLNQLILLGY